ncbi:MAG: hypothetical protein ABI859_14185, partial [Pseudomonadota bacterium]
MRNRILLAIAAAFMSIKAGALSAAGMAEDALGAGRELLATVAEQIHAPRFRYDVECVGADGQVKWRESFLNLVTTVGKNDILTQYFKGSAYTAAWYVGLIDNASFSAVAAGDTMASHSGWIEAVPYSNATRPALTLGTAASGSIDNSASKASYTINATATINGAFCNTVSTKSGTTGTLYSAGSFGATRSVISGDTLNV